MSNETQQFLELVRMHYAALGTLVTCHCHNCNDETKHSRKQTDEFWAVLTCTNCGTQVARHIDAS